MPDLLSFSDGLCRVCAVRTHAAGGLAAALFSGICNRVRGRAAHPAAPPVLSFPRRRESWLILNKSLRNNLLIKFRQDSRLRGNDGGWKDLVAQGVQAALRPSENLVPSPACGGGRRRPPFSGCFGGFRRRLRRVGRAFMPDVLCCRCLSGINARPTAVVFLV